MNAQQGSIAYVCRLSLVATLGGLLFGYDTAVIAGAIGFATSIPQFTPFSGAERLLMLFDIWLDPERIASTD